MLKNQFPLINGLRPTAAITPYVTEFVQILNTGETYVSVYAIFVHGLQFVNVQLTKLSHRKSTSAVEVISKKKLLALLKHITKHQNN